MRTTDPSCPSPCPRSARTRSPRWSRRCARAGSPPARRGSVSKTSFGASWATRRCMPGGQFGDRRPAPGARGARHRPGRRGSRPHTFTATAEVVRYLGADAVLVDVDRDTLCIDLRRVASGDRAARPRRSCPCTTRALPPTWRRALGVRPAARPRRWSRTRRMRCPRRCGGAARRHAAARRHRLQLLRQQDNHHRRGRHGRHPRRRLAERMRTCACTASTRRLRPLHRHDARWYYEMVAPGFKYNLTDIAAAIGLVQLRRGDACQRRPRWPRATTRPRRPAADLPAGPPAGDRHAWHLYVLRLRRRRGRSPRRAHRAPVRRGHRLQRALHPAAPAALLARPLRARRRQFPVAARSTSGW